jgi:hypothetical protein
MWRQSRSVVLTLAVLSPGTARTQEPINGSVVVIARPTFPPKHETAASLDKTLKVIAWPAYGVVPTRDSSAGNHGAHGRTEEFVLAGERFGFLADMATTERGLRSRCHEADPLNTLFGNRNQPGVLSSMTAWELGSSYASVAIPRWFERTRYRKPARILAVLGGSFLVAERVRTSIRNFQLDRPLHAQAALDLARFQ